jgi:LPXTG-motif cell wall-anchored protein
MDKNSTNNTVKGIIYASVAAFLWGFLAILLKIAVDKVPPITIVWCRFIIAFTFLFLFILFKNARGLSILIKPNFLVFIPALFLLFNYSGYMLGINYTSPNNAQIFIQLGPVILAITGIFIFKERLSKIQIIGFVLVVLGFYFFYSQQVKFFSESEDIYNKGVLYVIFGAIMWAGYAIAQKKLVNTYSTNQLNLFNFGLPAILLIPFVDFNVLLNLSSTYYILIFFLGLNTLIAYTCVSLALKYAEANKVSVIATCNPIITFITMAILGALEVSYIAAESMNFLSIVGAALVIIGAIVVVKKKRK